MLHAPANAMPSNFMTDASYYSAQRKDSIALIKDKAISYALEIGGGAFETLSAVKSICGCEAWGVDLVDAKRDDSINFIQGSFEDSQIQGQLPDSFFDLIIANDVIEHLLDTQGFFEACSAKLAPNGTLIMSVPNIRNLRTIYYIFVKGTFPRLPSGLFDRTHLRWFTKGDVLAYSSGLFDCVESKVAGRLVPKYLENTLFGELLGIHMLF
jgi:SAM-dependent methyltransferase